MKSSLRRTRALVHGMGVAVIAGALAGGLTSCVTSGTGTGTSSAQTSANLQGQELIRAAQAGDAEAQTRLGNGYLLRKQGNANENATQAAKWYEAAAKQGHAPAQANLGILYSVGLGVQVNKAEAIRLFRAAADKNNSIAQFHLGRAYLTGDGVPQDYGQARSWLVKAADQGQAEAQNTLGTMYENGQGVAKDDGEAAKWYRQAAEKGNATAQRNLASHYALGRGVAKDEMYAYFWYNLAASHIAQGQRPTTAALRDAMAARLTPAEIERAQSAAQAWKPGQPVAELQRDDASSGSDVTTAAATGSRKLRSTGTGFVVNKKGHVLTNAHVVDACGELRAKLPGAASAPADLVAKDTRNDLAVLKLRTPAARAGMFRDGQAVRQGDGIVVYGYPLSGALAEEGNVTTGNVSALAGLGNDSRLLQITAPVQLGNSGGPLVDMSGNVVGVIVSKLNALAFAAAAGDIPQNVSFAIKASVAREFLEANAVDYQVGESAQTLSAGDVSARAKQFTLKVECWR